MREYVQIALSLVGAAREGKVTEVLKLTETYTESEPARREAITKAKRDLF